MESEPSPTTFLERFRARLSRRLERLPTVLRTIGAYFMLAGETAQLQLDYDIIRRRTQRRMRAEDLVKGRDDDRAQAIADEEWERYHDAFHDDAMKYTLTPATSIDPWHRYDRSR